MDRGDHRLWLSTWQTLQRLATSAHQLGPGHAAVHRAAVDLYQRIHEGLAQHPELRFELSPSGVFVQRQQLVGVEPHPHDLARLLQRGGVLAVRLSTPVEPAASARLAQALVPYFDPHQRPDRPLAQLLGELPVPGLAFELDPRAASAPAPDSAGDGGVGFLAQLLRAGPSASSPLPSEALQPAWDGRGGRISWPLRFDASPLAAELQVHARRGTPMSRVGLWLLRAVASRRSPAEAAALLSHVPQQVQQLLASGQPQEVARFVGPVLRWASEPPAGARIAALHRQVLALGPALLDEAHLSLLRTAMRRGASAEAVAGYFQALPPTALGNLLLFLGPIADPGQRAPFEAVVRGIVERHPRHLAALLKPLPVPALETLLDVLDAAPETQYAVHAILAVAQRGEPTLAGRTMLLLARYPSRTVADRFVRRLQDPDRAVRRLVLHYLVRFRYEGAYDPLRELADGPWFEKLDPEERMEVASALGVIGRDQALPVARRGLMGFESSPPARVAPWVRCLTLIASPAAVAELESLLGRTGPQTHNLVAAALREARALLQRSSGVHPTLKTEPGQLLPVVPSMRRVRRLSPGEREDEP